MPAAPTRRIAALGLAAALATLAAAPPAEADLAACRKACQRLGSALMAALAQALGEGGPTVAIGVCRDRAPALATEISEEEHLSVRRTALKVRNPANTPDEWERAVLVDFQRRMAAGEDGAALERSEVVTVQGKPTLRYMKAILVAEPCLKCHGAVLDPAVAAAVAKAYPEDRATGFQVGDLRGAFSVRRTLAPSP